MAGRLVYAVALAVGGGLTMGPALAVDKTQTGSGATGGGAARLSSGGCVKQTCAQIKTCEEARRQLSQCGNKGLDRDGDGIPCESLCKPKSR